MDLKPRLSSDGSIALTKKGWRLTISDGPSGSYRLSQLDDQFGLSRKAYRWAPPLTLTLHARLSSNSGSGTWGFGLWNDPFGFSLGPGDTFFRMPALPNAIWFFYSSPKNYLSFRDDKPAWGFLCQAFRSPRFHPILFPAGLVFPFSRKTTRRLLSNVIAEDSSSLQHDFTQWHLYRLEWSLIGSRFWMDDDLVFRSPVSPKPPLGVVIWIDNIFAAFMPDGKLKMGTEKNTKSEWLEIEDLDIKNY